MIEEDSAGFPAGVYAAVSGPESWQTLVQFVELLRREGDLRGLIGPRELPRLWSRHVVNSLAVSDFIRAEDHVCDVGSGAGFPGLVLAIARPEVSVTLVETMDRRCVWLNYVKNLFEISNVEVVRSRAEDLAGTREFDVVTARAVAALDKLLRWTWPLVRSSGSLLALKGSRAAEEIESSRQVLRKIGAVARVHEVASPLDGTVTNVVEVRSEVYRLQ